MYLYRYPGFESLSLLQSTSEYLQHVARALEAARQFLDHPDFQWLLLMVSWLSIFYCVLEKKR